MFYRAWGSLGSTKLPVGPGMRESARAESLANVSCASGHAHRNAGAERERRSGSDEWDQPDYRGGDERRDHTRHDWRTHAVDGIDEAKL